MLKEAKLIGHCRKYKKLADFTMGNSESQQTELGYCHGDKCKLKVINLALNFKTASNKELDDIVAGCWLDCKARAIRNDTEKYQPLLAKVLRAFYDYTKTEDRQVMSYLGYFDSQKRRDIMKDSEACSNVKLDAIKRKSNEKEDLELGRLIVNSGISC